MSNLAGKLGKVGLVGLPVALFGIAGFFGVMNYDTWIAGQDSNTIGPNQLNAMLGAVAVAGVGVFLTFFGFIRARAPSARQAAELAVAEAPAQARAPAEPARPPPARVEIPEPAYELPPEPAYEPEVEIASPAEAEEEEEGEVDLTPTLPPEPAAGREEGPAVETQAAAPPAAPAGERDELEDLFGELESEVAKAEEDEVHYECPNCHGIVREDDASCPHCNVVFEG